jgi:hypothetical protein
MGVVRVLIKVLGKKRPSNAPLEHSKPKYRKDLVTFHRKLTSISRGFKEKILKVSSGEI